MDYTSVKSYLNGDGDAAGFSLHQCLVTKRTGASEQPPFLLEVGTGLFPYLLDHGVQDLIVLPGSFYVELALCVHIELLKASVGSLKRVEFREPVILSEGNVTLSVGVNWLTERTVRYTFRQNASSGFGARGEPVCAVLEIECDTVCKGATSLPSFSVEAFQQRGLYLGDRAWFYGCLRKNGNQYGPRFQNLWHLWRSAEEALGRLRVPHDDGEIGGAHLDPIVLDSVLQLLSSLLLDEGRTFILRGVEEIVILGSNLPEEVWVHASLRARHDNDAEGGVGDLDVFDDEGTCLLSLRGVRFNYLERTDGVESDGTSRLQIVISSTFTAEPVADSLRFWGDYFGVPLQVDFAPYNQVFQELLSSDSRFRRNQDGLNVILLNLADWAVDSAPTGWSLGAQKAAACLGDLSRYTLPNGLEVAHLNRNETEYVYTEIFEDECYLRHGIHLPEDAIVIDIGANIGLFSLFVRGRRPRASVYAYEPNPIAFRALKANCEAHGPGLRPFNVGVSERCGSAPLSFYERASVFSSFRSSEEEDRTAMQAVLANMVRGELGGTQPVDEYVEEFMKGRLNRQIIECPLISVSDIIRDNGLQRVDLLKVDAEKCELEILRGIDDSLWPLINQVVVEVHDRTQRAAAEVQDLLAKRGFHCAVQEEPLLRGSGLSNVYATRGGNGLLEKVHRSSTHSSTDGLRAKVDQFLTALESFTRSATASTILCLCPSGRTNDNETWFDQDLAANEDYLLERAQEFPCVEGIDSKRILAVYPTAEFYDSETNQLGHVPYTPEGFAAIGSSLFRAFVCLRRVSAKVIVLDCDNTLWQGACGEVGPLGVTVTAAHRTLQESMVRQMAAGMLLCLCSKNSEADVWAVFRQQPGMALKREQIAAWRINWAPKSDNLRSMARELNLGLESMIFLDDNPLECAEMRANCPEVMTLQLPPDPERLPRFLAHVWAFDHLRITEEDRTRTKRVLENARREQCRGQARTLKEFIDGLQLQVLISEPGSEQFSRVSQLTLRTSQFNFTTIRRSQSQIVRYLANESNRCLIAEVSDRFGDYGAVGLVLYRIDVDRYDVDTFLLSCRVLGRGVEHRILSHLGCLALHHGRQWVDLVFRPTDRNQPAWEFIKALGADFMRNEADAVAFHIPAARLAVVRYDPNPLEAGPRPVPGNVSTEKRSEQQFTLVPGVAGLSDTFQRVADALSGVEEIYAAIDDFKLRSGGCNGASAGGRLPDTLSGKMLGIWRRAIGNPSIGLDDNFVDVGGTSLKAVQIVATVRRELHLRLSIVNVFECPTVRLLCEKLEPARMPSERRSDAMERGARRKQRARRRE